MKKKYTYRAVIRHDPVKHHDYIEWISGKPRTTAPLDVEVITWEDKSDLNQYKADSDMEKAVTSLKKLAELGTFSEIEDPVAWQREIRKDRPLPGRE